MIMLELNPQDTYTLVRTNGMTNKMVVSSTAKLDQTDSQNNTAYSYKEKGKRKPSHFWLVRKGSLVFLGEDLPFMVDSETDSFMVDACINFVTDKPAELSKWLVANNLNEEFAEWGKINYRYSEAEAHDLQPLFPQIDAYDTDGWLAIDELSQYLMKDAITTDEQKAAYRYLGYRLHVQRSVLASWLRKDHVPVTQ